MKEPPGMGGGIVHVMIRKEVSGMNYIKVDIYAHKHRLKSVLELVTSLKKQYPMDLPWGGYLHIEREPREPMEPGKFYALVALAAGALVVVLFLVPSIVKNL